MIHICHLEKGKLYFVSHRFPGGLKIVREIPTIFINKTFPIISFKIVRIVLFVEQKDLTEDGKFYNFVHVITDDIHGWITTNHLSFEESNDN